MAEEKKQKFAAAETKGGPGGGPPHARGGFQKPKDTKKTIKRLLTYITMRKSLLAERLFLFISIVAVVGLVLANYFADNAIFEWVLVVTLILILVNVIPAIKDKKTKKEEP